jgi:hypothetical protein
MPSEPARLEMQKGPQEDRTMKQHLPRKATVITVQPGRAVMWDELLKILGVHHLLKWTQEARFGVLGFNVCPSEFWSCFESITLFYLTVSPFCKQNAYLIPTSSLYCALEVHNLFLENFGSQLRRL